MSDETNPVPLPPQGWYPDEAGTTRWWDGEAWTARVKGAEPDVSVEAAQTAKLEADASAKEATVASQLAQARAEAEMQAAHRSRAEAEANAKAEIIAAQLATAQAEADMRAAHLARVEAEAQARADVQIAQEATARAETEAQIAKETKVQAEAEAKAAHLARVEAEAQVKAEHDAAKLSAPLTGVQPSEDRGPAVGPGPTQTIADTGKRGSADQGHEPGRSQAQAPGWFHDGTSEGNRRYWNGRAWEDASAPGGGTSWKRTLSILTALRFKLTKKVIAIVIAVVLIACIGGALALKSHLDAVHEKNVAAAEAKRAEAEERQAIADRQAELAQCLAQTSDYFDAVTSVRSRVAVGLSYNDYRTLVGDEVSRQGQVRAVSDECQTHIVDPLNEIVAHDVKIENEWNSCIFDKPECDADKDLNTQHWSLDSIAIEVVRVKVDTWEAGKITTFDDPV